LEKWDSIHFGERDVVFFSLSREGYLYYRSGHINNFKTQSNQKKVQCNEKQIGKGVEKSLFQTIA
jgi:hypothetical protein